LTKNQDKIYIQNYKITFCEETIRLDAGKADICVIKIGSSPGGGKVNFKWPPFSWFHHSGGNFCRPWYMVHGT
jgi:hypothetical protein